MSNQYPLIIEPLPDISGGPNGAQRMRSLLKQLARQHRVKVRWLPMPSANITQPEKVGTKCR